MKKDILFIGPLDNNNIPKHGDSIKNRHLVNFFKQYRTVTCIDTWGWEKRPWLLLKLIYGVFFGNFKSIVYSVSNVTAYKLTRLFTLFPIRKKFIYFMIGGYTPIKIAQGIYKAEPFRKLDKIIVEADRCKEFYEEVGIHNALTVYNFKPYNFVPNLDAPHSGKIKFVFLSRLTELKGIFLILDAIKKLNSNGYSDRFEVDYYGSISPEVKDRFLKEIENYKNAHYNGFLNLMDERNYNTLSGYDALLFPTMHPTEGFPGVIADAAIAGVPVIASNWNYAEELVATPGCGYIVPTGDIDALAEKMMYVIDNRSENEKLRHVCVQRATTYKMSNVLTDSLLNDLGI